MRVKVVYGKNSFDGFFVCIMITIVSRKNLFVGGSGILYERENLELCTPESYVLNFIRLTRKFVNENTILNIIEEQLKDGTKPGRNCLNIMDSIDKCGWLDDASVYEESIDLDESKVVDMINRYIREEEEW